MTLVNPLKILMHSIRSAFKRLNSSDSRQTNVIRTTAVAAKKLRENELIVFLVLLDLWT